MDLANRGPLGPNQTGPDHHKIQDQNRTFGGKSNYLLHENGKNVESPFWMLFYAHTKLLKSTLSYWANGHSKPRSFRTKSGWTGTPQDSGPEPDFWGKIWLPVPRKWNEMYVESPVRRFLYAHTKLLKNTLSYQLNEPSKVRSIPKQTGLDHCNISDQDRTYVKNENK